MHRCSPAIRHGIWNTSPPSPHRAGVKLWRNKCSWCYRNSSRAFSCQPARGVRTAGPGTAALRVLPHTPGPFAVGAAQCSVGIEQCLWWVSLGSSKRSHLHRAMVLCPLNYCAWKIILKINCEDLYFVSTSSQVVYLDYFVKFYTENNWKKIIFFPYVLIKNGKFWVITSLLWSLNKIIWNKSIQLLGQCVLSRKTFWRTVRCTLKEVQIQGHIVLIISEVVNLVKKRSRSIEIFMAMRDPNGTVLLQVNCYFFT